jgi:hypothetical protein
MLFCEKQPLLQRPVFPVDSYVFSKETYRMGHRLKIHGLDLTFECRDFLQFYRAKNTSRYSDQ